MTIKIKKPRTLDPLEVIALGCRHWGTTSDTYVLDVQAYRDARDAGLPIPTFQRIGVQGTPVGQPRVVDARLRSLLINSDLSTPALVEAFSAKHHLEPIIVRDLARRLKPVEPPSPHSA